MAYGQKYSLEYWRGTSYPTNAGLKYTYKAKIFQRGYVTGGGIVLTPGQITSSSNLLVGGLTITATSGVITFPWTAALQNTYGIYPLIWGVYDGQLQTSIIPVLDNTDTPTQITIDLGTIPTTNLILIIKKADVSTQYTTAFLTGTGGIITLAVASLKSYWIYYENQFHNVIPVYDNENAPTTATIDLGLIPTTNAYLQEKIPDAILNYSPTEILGTGGIITIPANIPLYGQYPRFYAIYDNQIQSISPVITPSQTIIDLGATPATNTYILIVSGGYAVGIQELKPATATPISLLGVQGDSRDKMQPLKGSKATMRVIAGQIEGFESFDLEDIYTDDETEYYTEIDLQKADDQFKINWSNIQFGTGLSTVDANLQIKKYSPASNPIPVIIVDAGITESGTVSVLRGDRITIESLSLDPWPVVNNPYMKLDTTGIVSQMIDSDTENIVFDLIIDKDIIVTNESFYEADFMALRSELFYNSSTGYPVAYSPLYHGATQIEADALAANDTNFYIDGQAYADAWPIGYPAIWRGFLVIDAGTQQAYQETSILELSFVDGIGLLKNYLFADVAGNYFVGKSKPKDIFFDCINRIGVPDMNIYIHADIFEETMDEALDPMVQVLHQLETYYLSTQTKPLDMGQVMEAALRLYGLEMRQNLGEWWITQIDSLFDSGELKWFKYSWLTGGSLSSVLVDYTVTLGCSQGSFDTIFLLADQMKIIDRAYRGQILNYSFKAATQINRNPNLIPTVSGGGYIWEGWTVDPLGSGNVNPGAGNNGARIDSNAVRPSDPPVITMTSEDIAVQAGDLLIFNLNFNNTGPVAFSQFQVKFNNGGSDYYLQGDGSWLPTTPFTIYTYNGQVLNNPIGPVPPGDYLYALDSDQSIEIKALAIPGISSGSVTIILMNYDYSQNNSLIGDESNTPEYPNFVGTTTWNLAKASFAIATDTQGVAQGTFYIAGNIGNPTYTPPILSVLNADDDTAKYVGTLYREDETTPTHRWHRRSSPSEYKPLLWIIAEMYVRMYAKPYRIMQGTIYLWYPQLSRFIIDGWEGVYFPPGTDYELGSMHNRTNLIQINNKDILGAPSTIEETDYGQYSNGDLPVINTG